MDDSRSHRPIFEPVRMKLFLKDSNIILRSSNAHFGVHKSKSSKNWPIWLTIIHLPTLILDIFALIWPKSQKKHIFDPKMKSEPSEKYCHPDRRKKVTYEPYYHPLAHVNFGYFCPYITKSKKKNILDPKCALLDPKRWRSLPKIFSSWQAQKIDQYDLLSSTYPP